MSAKGVVEFYNNVMRDEDLKSKLGDVDPQNVTEEVFNERILPEAKKLGYDFTYADLQEYYNPSEKLELSADEMESVTGGTGCHGKQVDSNHCCDHYNGGEPQICKNCTYGKWYNNKLYCTY